MTSHKDISYPEVTLAWMPMHHLLATITSSPPTTVFGTRAKRHKISEGMLTTVKISHKNITARHKPHTLSQSAMGVHSISRILQHHLSTIFTSHLHHQPKLQTEPSNHNRMSSRHVKSFSNTRIDLLPDIAVTAATSHWLRSLLKAEAPLNTVARKEGRLHSQSTRKKRWRKSPDQKYCDSPKKANILQITYINPSTQTPSEPPCITRACSGHVMSSSNIRIDLM